MLKILFGSSEEDVKTRAQLEQERRDKINKGNCILIGEMVYSIVAIILASIFPCFIDAGLHVYKLKNADFNKQIVEFISNVSSLAWFIIFCIMASFTWNSSDCKSNSYYLYALGMFYSITSMILLVLYIALICLGIYIKVNEKPNSTPRA